MDTRARSSLALTLLLAAVVPVPSARAQSGEAAKSARDLYDSGTTHYNLREFQEALGDFKSAYRVRKDPVFLFNIAQCYRQLGDAEQAASYYRAFRREQPEASNLTEVDRLIAEMDKAIAARHASVPPTGPMELNERAAKSPLVAPPPPPTATPAIAVTATPPPREPKRLTNKAWFWVTLGGAVVVAGGAVALGVVLSRQPDPTPSLGRLEGP